MAKIPFIKEDDLINQQPNPKFISTRHNLPRRNPPTIQQRLSSTRERNRKRNQP